MKTKYPNQIDTPSELPIVRDNITEITSDVINSLRSAIIQIEKTLGINPQGAVGLTVSDRISAALDSSGNLRVEAIDIAGIVHGPIFNDQVSSVAAIEESKLKLNFPTNILQSEISTVASLIDEIQAQIEQISATLSAHISPYATNRHPAQAISVASIIVSPAIAAIKTFGSDNLQNTLTNVVNAHFNYTGDGINSENNSHSANQVYFDNSNVISVIDSVSVQGAIEELAGGADAAIKRNLSYLTKNGLTRFGRVNDALLSETEDETIVAASKISFTVSSTSYSTIVFDLVPTILKDISKFDILTISGAISDLDNRNFYISEITTDSGTGLLEIKVYGKLYSASAGIALGKISKNNFKDMNSNGLNCSVRLRNGYSNTPDIIVSNPNAATISSFNIRADLLNATNDSFKIQVDSYTAVTISCYNSSLGSKQSVDSIVDKINEQLSSFHLAAIAYKIKTTKCYEIAIAHTVPNFSGDITTRTIKISAADSNNGIDTLGLSHVEGILTQGSYGNSTFINGKLFRTFQNSIILSRAEVLLGSGSPKITSLGTSFLDSDIRAGDLIVVTGSSSSSDDGLFLASAVSALEISLDAPSGFSFSGTLSTTSSVLVIRSSAPISELNFEEIDELSGLMLVDIFATESSDILYSKRLEISGILYSTGFFASIIDLSKNFIAVGEQYYLKVNTSGMAYLEDSLAQTGEQVYVANTNTGVENDNIYKIKSPDGMSFVTIKVVATANPLSDLSVTLFGNYEVSKDNLILSRCLFSNGTGRIFGTTGSGGVPSVIDKRNFGSIDIEQICPAFVEKYIEGPRNELRSSGVISGCEVTLVSLSSDSLGNYVEVNVSPGVCLTSGIRREFLGVLGFRARVDGSAYFCINEFGCFEAAEEISGTTTMVNVSPFIGRGVVHLAYIDIHLEMKDMRFFVNNLDGKINHNIIVAKSDSLGHFTDIQKAINYCALFYNVNYGRDSDTYTYAPSILIREGEYTINSPLIIENDITISGVGKSTVLKRGGDITNCSRFATTPDPLTSIFIIGNGPGVIKSYASTDYSYSNFDFGVTIKDLSYYSPTLTTASRTSFCIFQGENSGADTSSSFTFQNISATGAPERETDNTIAEYFLVVARISAASGAEISEIAKPSKIFITSNFMKRIGSYQSGTIPENIAVDFTNQFIGGVGTTSYIQDIICTSNICVGVAPTAPSDPSSILRTSFQYATLSGIIEASNVVRTGT